MNEPLSFAQWKDEAARFQAALHRPPRTQSDNPPGPGAREPHTGARNAARRKAIKAARKSRRANR